MNSCRSDCRTRAEHWCPRPRGCGFMPPPGCVLPRCPPPRRRTAPSRRGIKRTASSTSSPRYWFGRAYRPKQLAVGGQLLHVHCVLDRRCGARRRDYRQRVVADSGLVAEAGPARGDRGRAPSRRRRRLTARTEQIHETGQGCRIGGGGRNSLYDSGNRRRCGNITALIDHCTCTPELRPVNPRIEIDSPSGSAEGA